MPFEMRTVQEYGIVIDELHYYHESLQRWIHAMDPKDIKRKRKFICRHDSRNLSKLYFYEPDTQSYIEIPFRDLTRPPISIWELRAAKKKLQEEGYAEINEDLIFNALKKMNAIIESEKNKTKSARKMQARQKNWENAAKHTTKQAPHSEHEAILGNTMPMDDIFSGLILPFDDIEEAS